MSNTDFDVIVVGAGPVGLITARELGRLGHSVAVLERFPNPYPLPRAVAFDFEIGRYFAKTGLGEKMRSISEPVTDFYEWKNADYEPLVKIDWGAPGPSGWPVTSMFSQPELEEVLREAMPDVAGVQLLPGHEVVDTYEYDDHIEVKSRCGTGETVEEKVCSTKYVVGCDGANSFVRQAMEVENNDLGFFFDWLICDLIPLDDSQWSPINWQYCDPRRPTTLVSGGPGRRRWEFMLLPGETAETMNHEQVAWDLLKVWGRTPENSVLERHAVYRFQARWAKEWRKGRLLLAGDAAHLMPPFAGQGMCSGIRDAMNLTWKLDLVLRGRADDALLDTYGPERITHLQNAIEWSIALGNVICILDEDKARERDERMIAGGADPMMVMPPPAPPILGPGVTDRTRGAQQLVAMTSPQFLLDVDGEERFQDELLGSGWSVLARNGALGSLSEQARAVLRALDAKTVSLDGSDAAEATLQGRLAGPFAEYFDGAGIDLLVVRPDFYVYGAVSATEADALITGLGDAPALAGREVAGSSSS
ncbi:bifunctional 3-(3-hydroxy-phenyl)propionate/3-hydroxycinnamic acid hydroxylase MhpA [Cumulibacter manganitolerans]|uniref:bifunctional 3-(3-hydroxy-phenyl)propionate/3-hydroxycinnamic acid hydroxylase MhpA n=1 Tax=Cumulibacter manganitolerans TaxID=1884992 RepID=UPI0012967A40|nr:bifunctional 3-(3-hydroxy-phenyl)propionate/3-hydroxycinnamic acid hydroxylase [Cumulibacter manganitolerans]